MCLEQVFDAAELGDQLLCRFWTDAGYAGNIVAGIAHQAQDVDDLVDSFDLPFVQHLRDAEDLGITTATARLVNEDIFRDQLVIVFVGCDHPGLKALVGRLMGQRADDVVGLVAGSANRRDVERVEQLVDVRQLFGNVFRHRIALCFVLGKLDVPLSRLGSVKRNGDVSRLFSFDDVIDRIDHAKNTGRAKSRRGESGAADQSKVGTIGQRHPVQQKELFLFREEFFRCCGHLAIDFGRGGWRRYFSDCQGQRGVAVYDSAANEKNAETTCLPLWSGYLQSPRRSLQTFLDSEREIREHDGLNCSELLIDFHPKDPDAT